MLVARHPMRVALALIGSMLSLAGIYAMLGVHVIAVFQVLIYVGAVMVFMVYVIMLLDVRDPSFVRRFGHMLVPGVVAGVLLVAGARARRRCVRAAPWSPADASAAVDYLIAALLGRVPQRRTGCTSSSRRCCWWRPSSPPSRSSRAGGGTMDRAQLLLGASFALFAHRPRSA